MGVLTVTLDKLLEDLQKTSGGDEDYQSLLAAWLVWLYSQLRTVFHILKQGLKKCIYWHNFFFFLTFV